MEITENAEHLKQMPIPESGTAVSVQVASDGAVYLPVSQKVTAEESGIAASPWPPEVRDAVMQTDAPTTRLQKYFACLFLIIVLAVGSYVIQRRSTFRIAKLPDMELATDDFPPLTGKTDRALQEEAVKLADRGNYSDSFRILFPAAREIAEKCQRDRYLLCAQCFESYSKIIPVPWTAQKELPLVRETLSNLMNDEPDRWLWIHCYVDAVCHDFYDYEGVWNAMKGRRWKDNHVQYRRDLQDLQHCATLLRKAEKIADRAQKTDEYDFLCCRRAKLLLSMWLLTGGGENGTSLPDDENDPGVRFREEALKIAMDTRYRNMREFLEMRRFIAETILSQDTIINGYFWNGRPRFTKNWLQRELDMVREKLNTAPDGRK